MVSAVEDGYGFLIETTQYAPALVGSALPFTDARRHKEMMEKVRYGGTFIGLLRERRPVVQLAVLDRVGADGRAVRVACVVSPDSFPQVVAIEGSLDHR